MRTLILLAVLSLTVSPAFAQKYISWEAENFDDINGEKFQVFKTPEDVDGYTAPKHQVMLSSVQPTGLETMAGTG